MPSWNADRYLKFAAERCYRTEQSLPGYPGRRANRRWLAVGSSPTWGAKSFAQFAKRDELTCAMVDSQVGLFGVGLDELHERPDFCLRPIMGWTCLREQWRELIPTH